MSNVTHYEIGELVATVSAETSGSLNANARLYLNKSNNETSADFIDVGIPPTNGSVVNTMIAIDGITSDRVNFAVSPGITSSPGNRQNAHIAVGSPDGTNTAILLGAANSTSNVSLVKLHGGVAEDAGFSVSTGTATGTGIGFSFDGTSIPAQPEGALLTSLAGTFNAAESCIDETSIILAVSDEGFVNQSGGCTDTDWAPESSYIDVLYNSDAAIAGFQFDVDGATINSTSGGDAAAAGAAAFVPE